MSIPRPEIMIPIALTLLQRLCTALTDMADQGPRIEDRSLLVDLQACVLPEAIVSLPLTLLERACKGYLDMAEQGARTGDIDLMEDLDKAIDRFEMRRL